MNKATRRKMIDCIDEHLKQESFIGISSSQGNLRKWGMDTLRYLEDLGALYRVENGWRLTVHAPKVRQSLAHPWLYWLKENWFSVGILIVTGLVGVGTIVSNFL